MRRCKLNHGNKTVRQLGFFFFFFELFFLFNKLFGSKFASSEGICERTDKAEDYYEQRFSDEAFCQ